MKSTPEERPAPPRAVAVKYDPKVMAAPNLVAKGRGDVARRILELAAKHDVPVRRDADLVELLAVCDLGEDIPVELYSAVAELLAYLYRLNGEPSAV